MVLFLRTLGCDVHEAEDGDKALALLSRKAFDAVISDYQMPGNITGIDVLRQFEKLSPGKPKLLVTGFLSESPKNEAHSIGAAHLEKPVAFDDLLDHVEIFSPKKKNGFKQSVNRLGLHRG